MKIVFWGTPGFAVPSLQVLLGDPGIQVLGVVTQPDKRRGRGAQLSPSPVKMIALEAGLPVWQPARVKKDPETLAALAALGADFFVVVAYGQLLSPEILAMPRLGCVNLHGSLLPKYRGAAPIQWSLYHGEPAIGNTTMLMDEGMDTGAMLLSQTLHPSPWDTGTAIAQALAEAGSQLLPETLKRYAAGEVHPLPQPETQATYAPLLKREDFILDWQRPALALHHQVQGFHPHCGTVFREQPLKVLSTLPLVAKVRSQLLPEWRILAQQWDQWAHLSGDPGTVVGLIKGMGPAIATGEGVIILREVQPQGKKTQRGADFMNGQRLTLGEKLGN